jgi:hypothetical protein
MTITRNKVRFRDSSSFRIQNYNFQRTTEFKYLGSLVNDSSENGVEIKARLAAGNRCYFAFLKLLKSSLVSRSTKKRIYRSIIRPVVMYGAETWCIAANDRNKLYSNKPEGLRLVGRLRKCWLYEVEQDLKQIGVRGWRR